ncbi:MAG: sortase [Anaerolineaceae bacterium]
MRRLFYRVNIPMLHFGKFMLLIVFLLSSLGATSVHADTTIPQQDQTPLQPLSNPSPSGSEPRYLSGFGTDNSFTIFYEERKDTAGCGANLFRIYFNQTTSGPFGLASSSTKTNICESHFLAKNWPITISGTTYSYRAWGARDYSGNHAFYVSNNLTNWTQIYLGPGMFTDPDNVTHGDAILYGFHDIVNLNNNYTGFAESAGGNTYIVWSDDGDANWKVIAQVGGCNLGNAPLNLGFTNFGIIPTGNFLLMKVNGALVYGKGMIPANRSGMYLAVNHAAAVAATPAIAEAAFMNPANWTWKDGSTGLPAVANAILQSTLTSSSGHDIHEGFILPTSNPDSDAVVLYNANFAGGSFSRGLGCASSSTQCLVVVPVQPTDSPTVTPTKAVGGQIAGGLPIPITGFAPNRVTQLLPANEVTFQTGLDLRLFIPSLNIDQEIVGVPQTNGEWNVEWLGNQIGYLNGTAFPTWNGNSVLTGHVYDASGKPGVFIALGKLKWGDTIIIQLAGQNYIYQVRQVKTITDSDSRFVFQHETRSWLTLVTCKGYNEQTGTYDYRTVVKALLVNVEDK